MKTGKEEEEEEEEEELAILTWNVYTCCGKLNQNALQKESEFQMDLLTLWIHLKPHFPCVRLAVNLLQGVYGSQTEQPNPTDR